MNQENMKKIITKRSKTKLRNTISVVNVKTNIRGYLLWRSKLTPNTQTSSLVMIVQTFLKAMNLQSCTWNKRI